MTTPINSANGVTPSSDLLDVLAVAAIGGVLVGISRKNGRGSALTRLAGIAMIGVAARPLVLAAVRTAGAQRRSVAVTSSIEINRPVHEVFAFFKDFENFPRVVGAVRSVRDYQDGRSHWEVYTPSGNVVEWDAVVTKYVPNSVIAWESVVKSLVESSGIVRFTALSPTRTRVDVTFTHRPVQSSLKDAVRALFARPPGDAVDRDLDRIRFYLESLPPERADDALTADAPTEDAPTEDASR
jgi:uncharacterized membrane protein